MFGAKYTDYPDIRINLSGKLNSPTAQTRADIY